MIKLRKMCGLLLILLLISCGGGEETSRPTPVDDTNTAPIDNTDTTPVDDTGTTPSISINANDVKQNITMMGGDMERSHRNFHQAANQEEIIQWLVGDIKFDTFRVAYDKHQEITEGVKDFSIYDNAVLAMKMMKEVNPDIKFFATLESDYGGYNQGNHNNMPTFIYDYANVNGVDTGTKTFDSIKYGLFLADYVEYMEQSGVALTYLATAKENVQTVTAPRAKIAMLTLFDELSSRNVAIPQIIDAGTWSLSTGVKLISNYQDIDLNQHVAGYSSHNYWSSETKTWQDFVTAANNAGKFAYNDESSHGGGGQTLYESSLPIGSYAQKAIQYASGLQGEAIFELWPRGYGEVQTNKFFAKPIFFNLGTDGRRMRSYYIMKKFVNGAVNSDYIASSINELADVATMVFRQDDELTLWVMNQSDTSYNDINIAITELGLKAGMAVEHFFWEESSAIEGLDSTITLDTDEQLTVDIKAQSINVFVIKPEYNLSTLVTVNNDTGVTVESITVAEGDNVAFESQAQVSGNWSWSGPNGFTANQAQIQLDNLTPAMAGDYTATFSGVDGASSNHITTLQLDCAITPSITSNYQINDGQLVSNLTTLSIEAGDKVAFSPQSQTAGTWQWTGPKNFTQPGSQAELSNVKPDMTGTYVATFTSAQGCSTDIEYDLVASCSVAPTIVPRMHIAGTWSETNTLEIRSGDTFQIGPTSPDIGRWQWTGPNGFKAIEVGQLQFQDVSEADEGQYVATLTTPQGCSSSTTFETTFVAGGCTPSNVTPYVRVNSGAWTQTTDISVKVGDTIDIGPQPQSGGTWSWSGPNNYSSADRQIQISNIQLSQAGDYTATFTPNGGCAGTADFVITVSN